MATKKTSTKKSLADVKMSIAKTLGDGVQRVREVLSKLEDIDRQIILLRYFEEMSSQEVAKILGLKDGALRVRTFRVMQKMKDIFEALYGKRN